MPPVTCNAVPVACPANVFEGNVYIDAEDPGTNYQGVTEINGDLSISSPIGLEGLDCLEVVHGYLDIRAASGESLAGILPRLTALGGGLEYDVSALADPVPVDCALQSLQSLGTEILFADNVDIYGPIAGELNLSALVDFLHIRLSGTALGRIVLPSSLAITFGQLKIEDNPSLVEVTGFENMTLTPSIAGSYNLRIVDNPALSGCRVDELYQSFLSAGFPEDTLTVEGNAACP